MDHQPGYTIKLRRGLEFSGYNGPIAPIHAVFGGAGHSRSWGEIPLLRDVGEADHRVAYHLV